MLTDEEAEPRLHVMSFETVLSITLGVGLAAACGFRVFVPLLVAAIAARSGRLNLSPDFAWLGGDGALLALSAATILEVLAYSVPWLDHLLDAVATPAAVVAGVVASAAVFVDLPRHALGGGGHPRRRSRRRSAGRDGARTAEIDALRWRRQRRRGTPRVGRGDNALPACDPRSSARAAGSGRAGVAAREDRPRTTARRPRRVEPVPEVSGRRFILQTHLLYHHCHKRCPGGMP